MRPSTSIEDINGRVARQERRNPLRVENGRAHVDPNPLNSPPGNFEVEREDSPAGLDGHLLLAGQAMIVQIFGDAADAVAAHLAFRAVGVEHPHPGIGSFRGHDQDQAIAADPEMAIADLDRRAAGGRPAAVDRTCSCRRNRCRSRASW